MSWRDEIQDLASTIYAKAAPLDKRDRHLISDAARLIEWACMETWDDETREALRTLSRSVAEQIEKATALKPEIET